MAGEMVPHGAIEDAIQHALGRTQENPAELVVTGVSDEKKGESLLILSEEPLNLETLRTQLQQQGLPNLWIPKKAIIIDKVPRLPSGKLDLHAIGKIARELAAGAS